MKREDILFYLSTDRVRIYLYKSKREYSFNIDTSLFFKWGEIINVEKCFNCLENIISKINLGPFLLKPNIFVLYNDVCNCDLKFLYKNALECFNYMKISFLPLSTLIRVIRSDSDVAVYDKNYYTDFKNFIKTQDEKNLDLSTIIIGKDNTKRIHYAREDILWKTFKSYFTNQRSYGIIDIGDDEC